MTKTCHLCHKDFEGENASKWCIPCGNKVRMSQWRRKNERLSIENECNACGAKFTAKSKAKCCLSCRDRERGKSISEALKNGSNHQAPTIADLSFSTVSDAYIAMAAYSAKKCKGGDCSTCALDFLCPKVDSTSFALI